MTLFGLCEDHIEKNLSLDSRYLNNSTFFFESSSELAKWKIGTGDLLGVDRALSPIHGDLVVASLEGEQYLCWCFIEKNNQKLLVNESGSRRVNFLEDSEINVFGVVKMIIKDRGNFF